MSESFKMQIPIQGTKDKLEIYVDLYEKEFVDITIAGKEIKINKKSALLLAKTFLHIFLGD